MTGVQTVLESQSFRVELEIRGSKLFLRPIGVLNEDTNLYDLLKYVRPDRGEPPSVTFDLGGITRINSCGVREWILFFEKLQSMAPDCSFTLVNELMVHQANITPGLLGKTGTPVLSFEVPYQCPSCKMPRPQVIASEKLSSGSDLPAFNCPTCRTALESDIEPKEYFHFLRRHQSP